MLQHLGDSLNNRLRQLEGLLAKFYLGFDLDQ